MPLNIDISDLEKQYEMEVNRLKRQAKLKLQRVGEVYASTAKEKGSYEDQTGNLRGGNGYTLFEDNSLVESSIGVNKSGEKVNLSLDEIKSQSTKAEIELICGNGMDYASHVQRKGYDVTDSAQLAAEAEARKQFSK